MKKILIVAVVFLVALAAVFAAKNVIAQIAVSQGVKAVTGLRLDIGSMHVGILKTLLGIKDLKLFNPRGFQDKIMVDMPEIYVDYDLGAFLKGKVHLEEVRLNLKELTVVKNEKGELNLDSLKTVQSAKEEKASPAKKTTVPSIQIDNLELKVGKVIYKDYSGGGAPKVNEFNVNIEEHYKNITNPYVFGSLIVTRALFKTSIAKLANFDIGALQGQVTEGLKKSTEILMKGAGTTKEAGKEVAATAKETLSVFKKLLPVGENK